MADKTWTAVTLELGPLKITPMGDENLTLHIERRYMFLDANGEVLTQIAGGRVVENVEFASIPPAIQNALIAIDAWTMDQALLQEEML